MSRKLLIKVIGIVILAISIVILCFAGMKHSEQSKKSERALTLQLHISPIMYSYGLTNYTVKYYDYAYDVFAEGFEYLTNAEALSLLKELDDVSCNNKSHGKHLADYHRKRSYRGKQQLHNTRGFLGCNRLCYTSDCTQISAGTALLTPQSTQNSLLRFQRHSTRPFPLLFRK